MRNKNVMKLILKRKDIGKNHLTTEMKIQFITPQYVIKLNAFS